MNVRQRGLKRHERELGFSMIDVLVAILVLATGLLALAALQGSLTRNGADSRARSQMAAYTQSVIDRMRFAGFDTAAPSTTFAVGDTITPASSCSAGSASLTLLNKLKSDAKCAQDAAGVSNVTTKITTAQLYCGTSGSTFASASSCDSDAASYKQLKLTTTWTDATGQSRSLSFDTTMSPVTVSPSDNSLTNDSFALQTGGSPVVREANPGKTLGVIPIAVSSGSDAAATNPKPVVSNTGTTFSTLTYVASNADLTTIQQRVDTKVVQCGCQWGGAASADSNLTTILKQPYGPTYWDGTQYVSPTTATANGSGGSDSGIDTNVTQDPSCDICCRDRRDDVSNVDTKGNAVYFDPYTGDNTTKYNYVSNVLTPLPGKSGSFVQACRMIRVGGTYVAATDAHLNFFGLLATDNCAAEISAGLAAAPTGCTSNADASDTVPSTTTETSYGNFVKAYLYSYLTDLQSSGTPSVATSYPSLVSDTTGAGMYTGTSYQLNLPSNITISVPNTVNRWVYARGVYIDHLEALARTALSNAITNCGTSPTIDQLKNCALPVIPFTTINMSELANWSSSATSVIHISNTAVIGGDESSPKRGNVSVTSGQTGSGNPTANAVATTYTTNSGLTAVSVNQANSYYDHNPTAPSTDHTATDQRPFTVSGTTGSGSGNLVYFDVSLTGLSWMDSISSSNLDPAVSWVGTALQLGTAASGSANAYLTSTKVRGNTTYTALYGGASATVPIPVSVTATASAFALSVNVQNFNSTDLNGSVTGVDCKDVTSGTTTSANNSFTGLTECLNYQVDYANVTVGGANAGLTAADVVLMSGTTDGGLKEGAVVTLKASPGISGTMAAATAVVIPFTLQGTPTVPSGVCTSQTTCNSQGHSCNTQNTYTQTACSN